MQNNIIGATFDSKGSLTFPGMEELIAKRKKKEVEAREAGRILTIEHTTDDIRCEMIIAAPNQNVPSWFIIKIKNWTNYKVGFRPTFRKLSDQKYQLIIPAGKDRYTYCKSFRTALKTALRDKDFVLDVVGRCKFD